MRLAKVQNYDATQDIIIRPVHNILPISYSLNIFTDKDKLRLIKELERIVRQSLEYKDYITYLKNYLDMNHCSFFHNVTNKNRKFSIEIHHEPFTLFDITAIIVEKAIANDVDLNYFRLAEEVLLLHYRNMVGLIPLSITAHEAVHDGQLFIPLQAVYGNYVKFYDEYYKYIKSNQTLVYMLESKIEQSKKMTVHDFTVLANKYIYIKDELMDKIDVEKIA